MCTPSHNYFALRILTKIPSEGSCVVLSSDLSPYSSPNSNSYKKFLYFYHAWEFFNPKLLETIDSKVEIKLGLLGFRMNVSKAVQIIQKICVNGTPSASWFSQFGPSGENLQEVPSYTPWRGKVKLFVLWLRWPQLVGLRAAVRKIEAKSWHLRSRFDALSIGSKGEIEDWIVRLDFCNERIKSGSINPKF